MEVEKFFAAMMGCFLDLEGAVGVSAFLVRTVARCGFQNSGVDSVLQR